MMAIDAERLRPTRESCAIIPKAVESITHQQPVSKTQGRETERERGREMDSTSKYWLKHEGLMPEVGGVV